MTQISTKNTQTDCSPINSLYCTLKMKVTGKLNEKDLNKLYNCTLCNSCRIASINQNTRKKAVCKNLIIPHVNEIRENITKFGNPYGINSLISKKEQKKMETILFRGCTSTFKTPEIYESAENLLEGIEYDIMDSETCCGNILFNLGDHESGFEIVRRNVHKFKKSGVKRIITICPGCYNAFNKYYKGYDGFKPEIILLIDLLNESTISGEYISIQDPCHAKEKANTVRRIIKGSKNKSASPCCGAGAGVMVHNKHLTKSKASKSIENHQKIVTYCPFCYYNLSSISSNKIIDIYMLLDGK